MADILRPSWSRYFPKSSAASAGLTAAISAALGILTVLLAVNVFQEYGIVLFCGTPMALGILAPALHGIGDRRSFLSLMGTSILAQIALFSGMLIFGIEGIFCVLMAAPLWLAFAVVGTCITYPIHVALWKRYVDFRGFPVVGLLFLLSMPLWMGVEKLESAGPPIRMVTTQIEIDAPPEIVWNRVICFPDMPPPDQWLFHAGIARPIRAEIEGSGVGGTRYCVFSTGRAVEPIRTWQPGRLLELDVISTPPSMEETSIYPDLHPTHLEGYLTSASARFELIPLPGGRTRLIGTSWYSNRMAPAIYWNWWSDQAIKAVQVSVLAHIQSLSEEDTRGNQGVTQ